MASLFGDLLQRPTLSGDWLGARTTLEKKGITFDINVTQIGQGVVDGGKDGTWEYGGRALLTGNLDTGKLGLWPGGFLTLELEGNWTDSVNGKTGALMPANTNQLFPLPRGDNFGVPNLSFAQFLSPYAGLAVGKFDMLSGDANEFAHGKGDAQFFNTAFNINPVALVIPYSTLGGGAVVLPTKDPKEAIVNFLVLSATGKATTAGFSDLDSDKLIFAGEGRVRTRLFGAAGHQLLGAYYSNRSYTSLDQRLGFVIENRALRKTDDTWGVYYNFDQFLYEIDRNAGRGIGVFGRFGASKGNPNPAQYVFSAGVGGKGLAASRALDRFGAGFYYIIVNNPTFQRPFARRSFLGDEWGFEMYYNIAVTPWMLLTPDLQIIGPAQQRKIVGLRATEPVDDAVVLGVRLQLIL